jgi:hypothetical protein
MEAVAGFSVLFCWLRWSRFVPLRAGLRFAAAPLRRSKVFGWKRGPVSERVDGMSMDTQLQKHYALLLGIGSPWEVKTAELKLQGKKVEIELGWQWGKSAKCPECGRACSIHDSVPERTWRHLEALPHLGMEEKSFGRGQSYITLLTDLE